MSKAPSPKAPPATSADPEPDAPAPAAAAKPTRKLIMLGAAATLVLLAGGGGAWMALSAQGEDAPAPEGREGTGGSAPAAFVDAPEMVVNLRSPDGAPRFLKLRVMLVPASTEAEAVLKARLPLILDSFQPYLRELRPQDLAGSAAVFRLKEELRLRATDAVGPGQVKDILIQDMIQQ